MISLEIILLSSRTLFKFTKRTQEVRCGVVGAHSLYSC